MKDNTDVELENMENEQTRVMLLVHDLKPPFLNGKKILQNKQNLFKLFVIQHLTLQF